MGSLAKNANCILVLAILVATVLLPANPKFDDDLLFSKTGFDNAITSHPVRAVSPSEKAHAMRIQIEEHLAIVVSVTPSQMTEPGSVPVDLDRLMSAPAPDSIALPLRS